eukprot:3924234-Lingulodinium_polyedra.AAC.1
MGGQMQNYFMHKTTPIGEWPETLQAKGYRLVDEANALGLAPDESPPENVRNGTRLNLTGRVI